MNNNIENIRRSKTRAINLSGESVCFGLICCCLFQFHVKKERNEPRIPKMTRLVTFLSIAQDCRPPELRARPRTANAPTA